MTPWSKLFRLTALMLLLSAAVDLLGVDMLGSFWQDKTTVQNELQGSCAQDDCFCCATNVIPVQAVLFAHQFTVVSPCEHASASALAVPFHPLFRPPRV